MVATFTVNLFQNGCYPIAIQLSCVILLQYRLVRDLAI
jgi:hypothetical protein